MRFEPVAGWGALPEGWRYVEAAGVAVDVGELGSGNPVTAQTPNIGPRVTVLDSRGQRIGRFGGLFAGEEPGAFVAPHGLVTDSHGDCDVAEVSWTQRGKLETPPREVRCLQKFRRIER